MTRIAPENILRHELIGLDVKVVSSKNQNMRGVKGKIIDESRNMLTVIDRGRKMLIPKNVAVFRFKLHDGRVVDVTGERLVARPENRLKTKVRRW